MSLRNRVDRLGAGSQSSKPGYDEIVRFLLVDTDAEYDAGVEQLRGRFPQWAAAQRARRAAGWSHEADLAADQCKWAAEQAERDAAFRLRMAQLPGGGPYGRDDGSKAH